MTTTEVSTLSDRELEIQILEGLGWVRSMTPFASPEAEQHEQLSQDDEDWLCLSCGDDTKFALDDAEAHLFERQCYVTIDIEAGGAVARWRNLAWKSAVRVLGRGDTERRARLEACLMALQALNSPTKEN
jgi:hypothetical protein